MLSMKAAGWKPSALLIHVSQGERNPIEGKFGQAKTAYGLDRIRARLKQSIGRSPHINSVWQRHTMEMMIRNQKPCMGVIG